MHRNTKEKKENTCRTSLWRWDGHTALRNDNIIYGQQLQELWIGNPRTGKGKEVHVDR